jgi:hypothetical protein
LFERKKKEIPPAKDSKSSNPKKIKEKPKK